MALNGQHGGGLCGEAFALYHVSMWWSYYSLVVLLGKQY